MPIELPPGTAAYDDDRNPETSHRQLFLLLALAIGTVLGLIWLAFWFVSSLVVFVPPGVEQQLGRLIVPAYEKLAQPSPAQDTLNQMLDRLEAQLPANQREGRDYQVLYIPDATVNAIAIPGDRVIIYRGLLAQAQSENEVMMVLGHELGHFANRDHLRSLGRALVIRLVLAALLGDGGAISDIAVSGVATISQSQFSQGQERDADAVGLTLLQKVYGQVAGATDFFARLSKERGANFAILSTHPAPADRVRRLEQLIRDRQYSVGEKTPLPEALASVLK